MSCFMTYLKGGTLSLEKVPSYNQHKCTVFVYMNMRLLQKAHAFRLFSPTGISENAFCTNGLIRISIKKLRKNCIPLKIVVLHNILFLHLS